MPSSATLQTPSSPQIHNLPLDYFYSATLAPFYSALDIRAGPPNIFNSRSLAVHSDSISTTAFFPQSIIPETAPFPVSWFPHQSAFQWTVRIRETGAENTIYALAAGECSDPRLAQQRGEPGAPGQGRLVSLYFLTPKTDVEPFGN